MTRQERRRLARKPAGVRGVITIEPPIASNPLLQRYATGLDEGTRVKEECAKCGTVGPVDVACAGCSSRRS